MRIYSNKFRIRPLSMAIAAALVSSNAPAAAVSWVPNADGFWDVVANWSSSPALPVAADNVTLDVGGATARTITHRNGTTTINSLVSQENLSITGGSLTLASASSVG